MSKFKVGEIAVGQNFVVDTELNGADIEVISPLMEHEINSYSDGLCEPFLMLGYMVREPNGEITHIKQENLRKKKPPQEESTWEEVQEITGWSPSKVSEETRDE